jgi:hypothetical protein
MTVEFGHDIWDITLAMMLDRITHTGQSGQVDMTGQPGQVRQDRTKRTGCQDMIKTGLRGQVSCGREQWSRTAGTGQLRQDRQNRIGGQDRREGQTGQAGRTDRTEQTGQGNRDGTTIAGQSGYGSWDRTTETGPPG